MYRILHIPTAEYLTVSNNRLPYNRLMHPLESEPGWVKASIATFRTKKEAELELAILVNYCYASKFQAIREEFEIVLVENV